jgi:hypothetical protein
MEEKGNYSDSDGPEGHMWSDALHEMNGPGKAPRKRNTKLWDYDIPMWKVRQDLVNGRAPPKDLREVHMKFQTVRALHMNPKYWILLPYIHPSYRTLPNRLIMLHLKAGYSQGWDWGHYAACAGTSLETIVAWVEDYPVYHKEMEKWHEGACKNDPVYRCGCTECFNQVRKTGGMPGFHPRNEGKGVIHREGRRKVKGE